MDSKRLKEMVRGLSQAEWASRRSPSGLGAGYSAPLSVQLASSSLSATERQQAVKLASDILDDREVVDLLSDRIYGMLVEDAWQGRDRGDANYGGRL